MVPVVQQTVILAARMSTSAVRNMVRLPCSNITIPYANMFSSQAIVVIPTSIVKLPRTVNPHLEYVLRAEARTGDAGLRVVVLSVQLASAALKEAIAERLMISVWRRCARWASEVAMLSTFTCLVFGPWVIILILVIYL